MKNNIIERSNLYIDQLQNTFSVDQTIENQTIYEFYKTIDSEVPKSTVNWRIYELVQKGVLYRVARGKYKLGKVNEFYPLPNEEEREIYSKLNDSFPYINLCIWSQTIINQLTQHHAMGNRLFVEVEKDAVESVFYFLQDHLKSPIFLNPSEDILDKYVSHYNNSIIVKDLVSEAPTQNIDGVNTITIEKLLVDLFADKVLFQPYQGKELEHIFKNAFEKYTINESTLNRYASRRGKKEDINEYINQIIGNKAY